MEVTDFLRRQVKWEMTTDRGGPWIALCDICHERWGSDMHEIIPRRITMYNQPAQIASFNKYICALLCNECHVGKNLAETHETYLLGVLIGMYGKEAVLEAIQRVQDVSSTTIFLDLPEGL